MEYFVSFVSVPLHVTKEQTKATKGFEYTVKTPKT